MNVNTITGKCLVCNNTDLTKLYIFGQEANAETLEAA